MSDDELADFRYKNLGFIFQEFNLIDSLTIRDNIGTPLQLANIPDFDIKFRVEEIAESLNIYELLDKLPTECSGGQKQRAACARALVTDPAIIVADEPTGNLDSKNSSELLNILKYRNETHGTAIIMVTHDAMTASYAKKLFFIRDGAIEATLEKGNMSQKDFFL